MRKIPINRSLDLSLRDPDPDGGGILDVTARISESIHRHLCTAGLLLLDVHDLLMDLWRELVVAFEPIFGQLQSVVQASVPHVVDL